MFTKRFVLISSYFSQYHNKTCLDALPVTSNVKFKLGAINWTIVKMLKISSVHSFIRYKCGRYTLNTLNR